jgi:hypothetical protein
MIQDSLRELGVVDVRTVAKDAGGFSFPRSSRSDDPFFAPETGAFLAEVTLPDRSVEDAAWLVEAVSVSCNRVGIKGDAQISVRLFADSERSLSGREP